MIRLFKNWKKIKYIGPEQDRYQSLCAHIEIKLQNICFKKEIYLKGDKLLKKELNNSSLPFDPAISLLGLYPRSSETPIQKNLCTPMFIAAQFTIAKCWKQLKCPSVNSGSKNYGTFTGWNTTQKKERRSSYPSQQHGSGEHYAKWNKPGSEGQIPYDLTFNWNIINRRKKQTKYNQRHWS